jgi:hypothetical protein
LPNSLLQIVKITDRFLIHQVLQMAPEEKVQGREIWGSWWPLNRSPSPYPTSRKLCIQPLASLSSLKFSKAANLFVISK